MLKYINENLQVGDHITIESKTEVYQGVITELETASLFLSCEGNTVRLAEDDITGLQYFEDDDTCIFPFYIIKIFPEEINPDSVYGYDFNQRLFYDYFGGLLYMNVTDKTNELEKDLLLPDCVEYDGKLYAIEGVEYGGTCFPDTLTSVKLPRFTKEVFPCIFKECSNLKTIYLPPTIQHLGYYKVGGCTCCELRDMQGHLLDWELEKDWP